GEEDQARSLARHARALRRRRSHGTLQGADLVRRTRMRRVARLVGTLPLRRIEALALRYRRRTDWNARLIHPGTRLRRRAGLTGALPRPEVETRTAFGRIGAACRTELICSRAQSARGARLGGAFHRHRVEAPARDLASTAAEAGLERRQAGRPAAADRR